MLITFSSSAYANITMFGAVALRLLKQMGHSATVPGALLAEDIPAAGQGTHLVTNGVVTNSN